MTSLIDTHILGSDDLRRVTRRAAGTRPGLRFVEGAETIAMVRMDVQTATTSLARTVDGDTTSGGVTIFATAAQVAAAYLEGDGSESPLGWTSLTIAGAEYNEGPPGDRVEWLGRVYEITGEDPHDETGPLIESGRSYTAEERGSA